MKSVKRGPGGVQVVFHPGERGVLAQLVEALIELVAELLPDSDDEFATIVGVEVKPADVLARDPALKRLFPSAYPDDESADAEFRRYTEPESARGKVAAAVSVWNVLRAGDKVLIADDQLGDWLRTLTNIRLVLAERDEPDLEDVYEWVAWLLEALLDA